MAIFFDGMECPLCHKEIRARDKISVTGFVPLDHSLYRFSDAVLHGACYAAWPGRAEFERVSFQSYLQSLKYNEYWPLVFTSEEVWVRVGTTMSEINIILVKAQTEIKVPRCLWNLWIRNKWLILRYHRSQVAGVLNQIWPSLEAELPNIRVLMDKARAKAVEMERLMGK